MQQLVVKYIYIYTKNTTPSRFLLVINLVPEVKKKNLRKFLVLWI